MYRFTIYDIDNISPTSQPPGRTHLSAAQKSYTGSWAGGLGWAQTATRELNPGHYVCIATTDTTVELQGVWVFTVEEPQIVVTPKTVKAGV